MTTAKMKFLLGYNMNIFILCEGGNDPLVRGNKNLVEESTGGGGGTFPGGRGDDYICGQWRRNSHHLRSRENPVLPQNYEKI